MKLPVICHPFLAICGLVCFSFPLEAQEAETAAAPVDQASQVRPEDPDPFAPDRNIAERLIVPAARAAQKRVALSLRLETWEGTSLDVVRWQDSLKEGSSWELMRKDFLSGKARLVFSPSIGIDQATASSAESLVEFIYPTEYEPPVHPAAAEAQKQNPKEDSEWQNWLNAAGKYSVPTSFETRNTGSTFEATAQAVTAEEHSWDLSLSFEDVAFIGNIPYGAKDLLIGMPSFGAMRTGGLVRLKEGKWRLLSVMEPPRGLDGKPSDKRWVTLVRIDPEG